MRRTKNRPWTEEDSLRHMEMMEAGASAAEVGKVLNRSAGSCKVRFNLKRREHQQRVLAQASDAVIPASAPPRHMANYKRPWTTQEMARLRKLREVDRLKWAEIDRLLDRPGGASWQKYRFLPGAAKSSYVTETKAALADRDQRRDLEHTSITSAVFGDPLPGRSALDQMRSMQR